MPDDETNNDAEQAQTPAGDQQQTEPEPVSISASQSKFAGLAARFFGRPVRVEGDGGEEGESSEGQQDAKQGAGDQKDAASEKVTLTQEELRRMVQSEKDKELARERKAQQDQEKSTQLERLKRENPAAYIEQEDQAKAAAEFVSNLATHYDRAVLDTVSQRLPEKDRAALLGQGVAGLDGRKEFVSKALDLLLKQAEEKGAKAAEKKIRGNPALVKQVVLGEREQEDEPDLVEGQAAATSSKVDMNLLLRRAAGRA